MNKPEPLPQHVMLGALWAAAGGLLAAAVTVPVGEFSAGTLQGWERKTFEGETRYALVKEGRMTALKAESRGSASGLVRKIRVDLERTPYLNWSWRIDNTLGEPDEKTKAGDDYPARLYVVVSGGLFFWRTRAINYVWASRLPKESVWPNAFAGEKVMMVAVESGDGCLGEWVREKRDVRADLRRFFGEEIRFIDAVALMTDTDNSGGRAVAYYGDIYFSSE